MNAVTETKPSGLPSLASLKEGIAATAAGISVNTTGGAPFLRLLKTGKWVFGQENLEIDPASLWGINPYTIQKGFVAWSDRKGAKNEPLAERFVGVTSPMPTDLPEVRDDKNGGAVCTWKESYRFDMACCTGEDKGTVVLYNPTSYGGLKVCQEIMAKLVEHIDGGATDDIVPLVKMTSDSYTHKTYGQVINPIFDIVKWSTMDDMTTVEDEAPEAETPAPVEATDPAAEEAPTTRRRRRR